MSVRPDHWVYLIHDQAGELIYVGVTWRNFERLTTHGAQQPWSAEIATIRIEHFATREDALAREAYLIGALHPRYNVQGNPARPEPPAPDGYLSMREISAPLPVGPGGVVAAIRRGELEGEKIGRHWYATQAAVDTWLASRMIHGSTAA